MAEYTPSPQAVEAFKAAWREADAEGDEGPPLQRAVLEWIERSAK